MFLRLLLEILHAKALQRRLHVGLREVVALEQQRCVHSLGKGIGGAIAEIEPRLGVDTLAVAPKRFKRHGGENHIVRDDLGVDEGKEVLKVVKPIDAALVMRT